MFNASAAAFEALTRGSRVRIEVCDSCTPQLLVVGGSTVVALVPRDTCKEPEKVALKAASNVEVKPRGYLAAKAAAAVADAAIIAALMSVLGLVGLDPALAGLIVGVLAVALAVAKAASGLRRLRSRGSSERASGGGGAAATATVEIVASRLLAFLRSYCSDCRVPVPGYRCKRRSLGAVFKRV